MTQQPKKQANPWAGVWIPNALALMVMLVLRMLIEMGGSETRYVVANIAWLNFVLLPTTMGVISAYCWRNQELSWRARGSMMIASSAIGILLSAIAMGEGVICIIIVSPLVVLFMILGERVGHYIFRQNNDKLNISLASLLAFMLVLDVALREPHAAVVTDVIVINAPPSRVWQFVAEYTPNTSKPNYWLFNIGMPAPIVSTVSAHTQGADRQCVFSNGITFDEKMTVWNPPHELTFDITKQPQHPEIFGHIDILKGQFILQDNGNGTTTLIGKSWYNLHTSPAWYFDWWAHSITSAVHLHVMQHIKMLAEKK